MGMLASGDLACVKILTKFMKTDVTYAFLFINLQVSFSISHLLPLMPSLHIYKQDQFS